MINATAIFFAKYLFLLIPLISFVYFLLQKNNTKKEILIKGVIIFLIAFLSARILSSFFYNPRPFVINHFTPLVSHMADNGFPSDHALLSFSFSALIFLFNKKIGLVLIILGILVGFSRVFVGIHSPIDILGSFIISFSAAYLTSLVFKNKMKKINANISG